MIHYIIFGMFIVGLLLLMIGAINDMKDDEVEIKFLKELRKIMIEKL